jgi:hypothetical protein
MNSAVLFTKRHNSIPRKHGTVKPKLNFDGKASCKIII